MPAAPFQLKHNYVHWGKIILFSSNSRGKNTFPADRVVPTNEPPKLLHLGAMKIADFPPPIGIEHQKEGQGFAGTNRSQLPLKIQVTLSLDSAQRDLRSFRHLCLGDFVFVLVWGWLAAHCTDPGKSTWALPAANSAHTRGAYGPGSSTFPHGLRPWVGGH